MRQGKPTSGERIVKDIKRQTRKQYSAEEKIRIVLDGLRGEESIAELCRKEGIAQGLYYKWSKDFLEAGKKRLAGDIVRQATSTEVTALKAEARDLKKSVERLERTKSRTTEERARKRDETGKAKMKCFRCGGGHMVKDCPEEDEREVGEASGTQHDSD